jgi:histidinol-phosphate phosphatase family protein
MMSHRAVFLDKDGTLIEDVPYNVDPTRIRFTPGAARGVRLLHHAGFRLFVISNQEGVAQGRFPEAALINVQNRLQALLGELGVPLAGFYYCPHDPAGRVSAFAVTCSCRKPAPGLLLRAAKEHLLDLKRSWFIGDILDDIEAGRAAGCRTILLANGHENEWVVGPNRLPDYFAADLTEAAGLIVAPNGRSANRGPLSSCSGRDQQQATLEVV